jgi:hypothetical protein
MDISERQSKLNTQIRFHNYQEALPLAYALRLELELINKRSAKQNEQLENVRLTVRQLERLTRPWYIKVSTWLWHKWALQEPEEVLPPLYEEPESALESSQKESE